MSYQKNDVLTVKIEDMGHDGEGIGKCEGYTLFVKDTVIGDLAEVKVIKAKKNYGYARLMRLIEPSAHRVEPVCPVARPCGGCQLQMLDYAEQLRFKEKKIVGNLQRIGGMAEIPMEPIVGMENPFRYRNKAQFPIGQDRNGKLITGFYAGRTHQIMENRNCYLGVEQNEEILNRILAWMEENGVPAYNEETGKAGAPCADPVWIYDERDYGLSRCERKETAGRGETHQIADRTRRHDKHYPKRKP